MVIVFQHPRKFKSRPAHSQNNLGKKMKISKEIPMFWSDRIAKLLVERKKYNYLDKPVTKPKNFRIKVAFGVDEENISQGTDSLVRSGWLDDVNFAIVPETGTSDKNELGPRMITLGRRGRVAIKIIVRGKSAHGAQPELGINAIEDASRIILALENLELKTHDILGKSLVCPLIMKSEVECLSVPELSEIVIDRHIVPPETEESVLNQVKELIDNLNLKSSVELEFVKRSTPFLMPYITPKTNPFVEVVSDIIRKRHGEVVYNYGLSVADENYFGSRLGIPVIVIGLKGGNDHAANEWVN